MAAQPITLHTVTYGIPPQQKIGNLKKGMLCLPAGKVLWRDVALPAPGEAERALSAALSSAGVPTTDGVDARRFGDEPATGLRIAVHLTAIELKQCAQWGGFHAQKPSGEGRASFLWEVWSRDKAAVVHSATHEAPLPLQGRDIRIDPRVIVDAMVSTAGDFANGYSATSSNSSVR